MKDLIVIRPYETTYGLYRDEEVRIIKKEELLDMEHNFDILWDLDDEEAQIRETNKDIKIIHEQGYSYWRIYNNFYWNYEFSKLDEKLRNAIATVFATSYKYAKDNHLDIIDEEYDNEYWFEETTTVGNSPFLYEEEFDFSRNPDLKGKMCFAIINHWYDRVYIVEGYNDFFCTLMDDEGKFYLHNCGPYLEKAVANNTNKDCKEEPEDRLVKVVLDVRLRKGITLNDFYDYIDNGERRDDFYIAGVDETERPIVSNINNIDMYKKTLVACENIIDILQEEITWNKDRLKELSLAKEEK